MEGTNSVEESRDASAVSRLSTVASMAAGSVSGASCRLSCPAWESRRVRRERRMTRRHDDRFLAGTRGQPLHSRHQPGSRNRFGDRISRRDSLPLPRWPGQTPARCGRGSGFVRRGWSPERAEAVRTLGRRVDRPKRRATAKGVFDRLSRGRKDVRPACLVAGRTRTLRRPRRSRPRNHPSPAPWLQPKWGHSRRTAPGRRSRKRIARQDFPQHFRCPNRIVSPPW